eukprot:g6470.t1
MASPARADIFVCQASSCLRNGSQATFVEIEELAKVADACARNLKRGEGSCNEEASTAASTPVSATTQVHESGCLGLCNRAPGTMVRKLEAPPTSSSSGAGASRNNSNYYSKTRISETPFTRVNNLEQAARVVARASGIRVGTLLSNMQVSEEQRRKLDNIRLERARQHAVASCKWNAALKGLDAQIEKNLFLYDLPGRAGGAGQQPRKRLRLPAVVGELVLERATLFSNAGLWKAALRGLDDFLGTLAGLERVESQNQLAEDVLSKKIGLLVKHNRSVELEMLEDELVELEVGMDDEREQIVSEKQAKLLLDVVAGHMAKMQEGGSGINPNSGGHKQSTTNAARSTDEDLQAAAAKTDLLQAEIADMLVKEDHDENIKADDSETSAFETMSALLPHLQIEKYSKWTLTHVSIATAHSAVFHFASKDRKRGTPHVRGSGRGVPTPKTWHITLLAPKSAKRNTGGEKPQRGAEDQSEEVDHDAREVNPDGPLPLVERDYTPISCAKEWEQGKCDILIKIYQDGQATSYLHKVLSEATAAGVDLTSKESSTSKIEVWMSQPQTTLEVPSFLLVPPGRGGAGAAASNSNIRNGVSAEDYFDNGGRDATSSNTTTQAKGILMILAGTGIVALPQLLAHRDPTYKLGIATRRPEQVRMPVDVLLSCRRDDVLLLPEITEWGRQSLSCSHSAGGASGSGSSSGSSARPAPGAGNATQQASAVYKGIRHCSVHLTPPEHGGPVDESRSRSSSPDHGRNKGGSGTTSTTSVAMKTSKRKTPFVRTGAQVAETETLLQEFKKLGNCRLEERRLEFKDVAAAVARMEGAPCRVLVSGPSGFNAAVRAMLLQTEALDEDAITILTA